jgi:hypothetical protein
MLPYLSICGDALLQQLHMRLKHLLSVTVLLSCHVCHGTKHASQQMKARGNFQLFPNLHVGTTPDQTRHSVFQLVKQPLIGSNSWRN